MSYESETTPLDILGIVVILVVVALISLFLFHMLRSLGGNIEDNALKRAATELAENILNSDIADDGAFLPGRLQELDKTATEVVNHCYGHRVRVTTQQKINGKDIWGFGYSGNERDYSIELPSSVISNGKPIPAKFELTVFDTFAMRCK